MEIAVAALIVNTIALIVFISLYYAQRKAIRGAIAPWSEFVDRYADPEDTRYSPHVRGMVKDLRRVREIVQ